MKPIKFAYIETSSDKKYREIAAFLSKNGLRVSRADATSKDKVKSSDGFACYLREQTQLNTYNMETEQIETGQEPQFGDIVLHTSELYVSTADSVDKLIESVIGYLCESEIKNSNIFGWDAEFINWKTKLSNYEMSQRGLKFSARDQVLSQFIEKYCKYQSTSAQYIQSNIDLQSMLDDRVYNVVSKNLFINNDHFKHSELYKILKSTVDLGLFFKSRLTRRQANYWFPNFNGGIPVIAKSDELHEITFLVHDLFHFAIQDLLLSTGSAKHQDIYQCYRVMSECITLTFADMFFIQSLERSGFEYDYSKREVYPILRDSPYSNINASLDTIKQFCWANIQLLMCDNSIEFNRLGVTNSDLEPYRNKFKKFFVCDFMWTRKNSENILKQPQYFEWLQDLIIDNPKLKELQFASTSDCQHAIYSANRQITIHSIFEYVWSRLISLSNQPAVTSEVRINRAILRYWYGQLFCFYRFSFVPGANRICDTLISLLAEPFKNFNRMQQLYQQFIVDLYQQNYISANDYATYQHVFPLYDQVYVFYDSKESAELTTGTNYINMIQSCYHDPNRFT